MQNNKFLEYTWKTKCLYREYLKLWIIVKLVEFTFEVTNFEDLRKAL